MAENNRDQLMRAAMFYGLLLGGFWVLKYLFFVAGVFYPVFSTVYALLSPLTLVVAYLFTKVYKILLGGKIRFVQAWQFGVLIYFFGGLIESLPQYVFFRYIAPADYIQSLITQFSATLKQISEAMNQANMQAQMEDSLQRMNLFSPINLTLENLGNTVLYGIILSLPVAAILCRGTIDVERLKREL
ncbi:MAG: DUF4199 domain-containing protein [Tannerella sp.]|jgi:hypothetical protein|nr:DUF4199 domain-containing protein [Tannerella sp.]